MDREKREHLKAARKRLKAFVRGETDEKLFAEPTGHPSSPTGFCFCDHSLFKTLIVCFKAFFLEVILRLPFNGPKIRLLKAMGANIGKNVYISAKAWIDPTYPELLTIEDNVFIGMEARILFHEFRIDEFRVGKVVLRSGCFVGGCAVIGCGTEIGEGATVAAGAMVGRDVPPHSTMIGNPGRIIHKARKAER